MDLNLVVLCGRVAIQPELRSFESGASLLRILMTVRTEHPQARVDLIPVIVWDPADELTDGSLAAGDRIWVSGILRRRFWTDADTTNKRSRIEVIGQQVTLVNEDEVASPAG
jgi:single-stranded DNA-binding protein